jgi:natural product biosynthesis luciferase-like monooxygenase protein/amino acid adenylation domain-containing protein
MTSKNLEQLSAEAKRALLEKLLQERARPSAATGGNERELRRRDAPGPRRLSSAQERLWFLDQLEPGAAMYTVAGALRLRGPLDVAALRRALNDLYQRHEVLRARYTFDGTVPLQQVAKDAELPLELSELTAVAPSDQQAELDAQLRRVAGRTFDLGSGPVIRTQLFQLGAEHHVLAIAAHHIVWDGWSAGIFFRELRRLYEAHLVGRPADLEPLPLQYADFAEWQQDRLRGPELARQITYWRAQLKDAARTLDLPTSRPRPPLQTFAGAVTPRVRLSPAQSAGLRSLAQAQGASLFMVMEAAWRALLFRYTGQADISIGTPTAGRPRRELEALIGCFANTLVLRVPVDGMEPFTGLVRRVRAATLSAFQNQEVPFERLVEELNPERDVSRSPLVQALFIPQNTGAQAVLERMGPLGVEQLTPQTDTAKFELSMFMLDTPAGIEIQLEYNTDLFDRGFAERTAGHYQRLLQSVVETPDLPVGRLPLLGEAESHHLVSVLNDTAAPAPAEPLVHRQFEAQVDRTPEAEAVVFRDRSLTFRGLDDQANQLAHRLRRLGVGPEDRVGLCLERSLEMVVALLAIHKAGAAYVPLDPAYPRDRLAYMLEDSGARVLVTRRRLQDAFTGIGATVLCVDGDELGIAEEPRSRPAVAVGWDCPAYVIYTSGSTGRPKGVVVLHRNLTGFLAAMDGPVGSDRPGTWLALTTISFDISGLELFWTLTRGFRVVVQSEEDTGNAAANRRASSRTRPIDFSLMYFADDAGSLAGDKYRLLLEGARFADREGFTAVWTPERHFHSFGGLYPNPAVVGAALAMVTQRLQIRAGSVVLPLHDPLRVAEEWSVVDNLSRGRVGMAIASGWHPDDFVLAPDAYPDRKKRMFSGIDELLALWSGQAVQRRSGAGKDVEVRVWPRPLQERPPLWLTSTGSPDTFRAAGERGMFVLTHLLGQELGELGVNIAAYREAWQKAGHPGSGSVSLMLHTFVSDDLEHVRQTVRGPFIQYLRSSADLSRKMAQRLGHAEVENLAGEDLQTVLELAFDRYFQSSGLFGTPESCQAMVDQLRAAGVDEVACLIDFGVDADRVLESLGHLAKMRGLARAERPDYSVPAQLRRHQVTHLQCTPTLARMLLDDPEGAAALPTLRKLMVGGEAFPAALAEQLLAVGVPELLNMYGPTETTIWSAVHPVRKVDGEVPLGRPIANTRLHVVDGQGQLVPVGVPGELLIGGMGVVRGYHRRPDLTAERFVPDPFGAPGGRLYRTGDRARVREDGTVQFLGRLDFQVKIRGHRIELGEVETALAAVPGVREAVVVARPGADQGHDLVGYVIRADPKAQVSSIKAALGELLPEYMVPSSFVFLEAFPLTPNGKVDRKALPAPSRSEVQAVFVAPRGLTQERVASVWAEVLGVDRVGAEDNFFDLGGHSLRATQVVARLRAALRIDLPLLALFEHPTVVALAADIERRGGAPSALPAVKPAPRSGPVPLSFGQETLWFLDQLQPGRPNYVFPLALRLRGAMDVAAMQRALTEVVARHESLRTTFGVEQGRPVQVVQPPLEVPLPVEPVALEGLQARIDEEARTPFDLATTPQFRARLLAVGPQDHVLLVTMHHISTDGVSADVVLQELGASYGALREGRAPALAAAPLQYADFALWQRAHLTDEALAPQLDYWRKKLADAPSSVELPLDRPRPAVQSGRGASSSKWRVPRALEDRLRELARREGVPLFMLLEAAFHLLLHRYSGQDDICVGTAIAGRTQTELERVVGYFLNTLVLRVDAGGNPRFLDLLGRVRQTLVEAYQHQDVPLERLIKELQPARDLSTPPLFQAMFVLQDISVALKDLASAGLQVDQLRPENGTSKIDLWLFMLEEAQGLTGSFQFNTDLFESPTVERMLRHYQTLLERIVEAPAARLSELSPLDEGERQQLLQASAGPDPRVSPGTLHGLFEAQVRAGPDRVAVEAAGVRLTYVQLDQRANRLARHLKSLGVGPEVAVALAVRRSADLPLGMLAIWKAGGVYVPVDPDLPAERLLHVLQDSGAPVVVTTSEVADLLPAQSQLLVCVDEDGAWTALPADPPVAGVAERSLAYVIYTSGSTGVPKGVLIEHDSAVNTVVETARELALVPGQRVLQFFSMGFDVSVGEILGALCAGATLVMPGAEEVVPGAPLTATLRERHIDVVQLPSSLLAQFPLDALPQLKTLGTGGEAFSPEVRDRCATGRRFVNSYGPTETTITAAYAVCTPGEGPVTIGGPLAGVRTYVLDAHLQPVPVGVAGELYIAGAGVARGYLGRPDLTAARFLPDPLLGEGGGRMYRTGDRVRWLPDGRLQFLERVDQQVKLRGFRIELGEIEARLAQHPAVAETTVIVREDRPGDRRLVAYVVSRAEVEAGELRQFLRRWLPDYMLPAAIVPLEQLPRGASGKVDRRRLPAPDADGQDRPGAAPRSPLEQMVAQEWSQLLGRENIGVADDFFELGGHSLLAAQLIARLRERFHVEVPIRVVFESPTVAGLAEQLEQLLPRVSTEAVADADMDDMIRKLLQDAG